MASENSYKSILKGTSMFGGVQVFQILINWARGKCVAVLLGPEGMGIASLFTSASNTVQKFASLGLNLAIVREMADNSRDPDSISRFIGLSIRILAATSLLSALICILFARPLSRVTFGSTDMSWQFMLLGIAVGFGIAGTGILSILQGLHEVKRLSKASIVGGLTGLFIGVPLYYLYGTAGIVPAMIALSVAMFIFYYFSLRKSVVYEPLKGFAREHASVIKRMIGMGIILMASDLIGTSVTYGINIFIHTLASDIEVGLYQAANSATAQYSGMVFTAMAMDYFPRLTKASNDRSLMHAIVNRQTEIVALIIAPAACLLIITAPLVIQILFTREYDPILPLMRWMGLGITLRALMMPMGYITFAKDNKKAFFALEGLFGNLLTLALSCIGFYFFGLIGLGYAFLADNALCLLVYYVVNRRLYGYRFTCEALKGIAYATLITVACFLFSLLHEAIFSYSLMAISCTIATVWGVTNLRNKLKSSDDSEGHDDQQI
ncbi:MAG: O-antigen translocase [Muribaculaceae bacterium]|nr:O-antigen translocase [Muribaculaceae bacterium]